MVGCSEDSSQFETISGQKQQLSDYSGKWVLMNFWAEWCRPCLEEIPILNELNQRQSSLNLAVFGVSYDKISNDEIVNIIAKYDIQYPILATDPQPLLPFKLPNKLPASILIQPNGIILGPFYGKSALEDVIKQIEMNGKVAL